MKLKDPNKAAHEIIEVLEDGDAVRNDGLVLQAANKNPWYVLATLHGEQGGFGSQHIDDQNRNDWNRWSRRSFTGEPSDEITKLYRARIGDESANPPDRRQQINFSNTYFPNGLNCNHFVFHNTVLFDSSVFGGTANFIDARLKGNACFQDVEFKGEASFNFANFEAPSIGGANFKDTRFWGGALFHSTIFNEDADFQFSEFRGEAEFSSAQFKASTSFTKAQFITEVPKFHATTLYDDTVFTLPDKFRENWPPLRGKDVMEASKQKRAYNRLRLFMNKSVQIEEEQFFHRMEMRCKRETEGWQYRWIYTLFEGVSDYGNSVLRPAGWLFVVWLSGVWAKLEAVSDGWWPDYHSIPSAMGWSFANLFSFFGFYRRYFYSRDEELDSILQLFSATQTVFGFALLFMLGLGLRNRFRLR